MAETKTDFKLTENQISQQEAIVKRLSGKKIARTERLIVPSGKQMLEQVDQETLSRTLYTFLRYKKSFGAVRFSIIAPSDQRKGTYTFKTEKVMNLVSDEKGAPQWEITKGKRKWLAETMAEIITRRLFVYIEAKADGIYVTSDTSDTFKTDGEDFLPHFDFVPKGS